MRRQVVRVAVGTVLVALALFGIPLGVLARQLILNEERGELESTALVAAAQVAPGFGSADPVELPVSEPDKTVAVYDGSLRLSSGQGPTVPDAVVSAARSSRGPTQAEDGGQLVAAVPVVVAEDVIAVVRTSSPAAGVWASTVTAWGLLLALAAGALGGAVLVARSRARLLSEPLEALAQDAARVTDGDLGVRSAPSLSTKVEEVRRLADAQDAVLERLSTLLEHERQFSANVSHQLRTPLAALQLTLDNFSCGTYPPPRADWSSGLSEALGQVRTLDSTITELLRLSRIQTHDAASARPAALSAVLAELEGRWRGPLAGVGRRLVLRPGVDHGDGDQVPGFVVTEVLSILLENAVRHGVGQVEVTVRDLDEVIAMDVSDEGRLDPELDPFVRGRSATDGTGIGLALARSLAESVGGRLRLAADRPTRFSVLLPRSPAVDEGGLRVATGPHRDAGRPAAGTTPVRPTHQDPDCTPERS